MSDAGISKHDQVLAGLVISLQAAAMQHLGKLKNPLSDAIEKDLVQARGTIDILEMLKAKCRQDTHAEILRMLDTAVMELQMNYLDEMKKEQAEKEKQSPDAAREAGAAEAKSEQAAAQTAAEGETDRAPAAAAGEAEPQGPPQENQPEEKETE